MSKAAKRSLYVLIVLLLVTFGLAAFSVFEKQKVEEEKAIVEQELVEARTRFQKREKKYIQDARKLQDEIQKTNSEKNRLTEKINAAEKRAQQQIDDLTGQIDDVTSDRDKWKRRIDTIREERDKLLSKIDDLTEELEEASEPRVVYREREPQVIKQPVVSAPPISPESGKVVDEEYWANLLEQKASLEVDIQKLKSDLSEKSIEIVGLRQGTEDLKLEVDSLKHQKEEVEATLQHKLDMIDSISLELARTKNDKKFIADRVEKLNAENNGLRQQMKQLVSVKNALEKSIVRLSKEKEKVEGKLGKTETLIQSKIDEIWEIKDDLDRSIRSAQSDASSSGVELPPIVVSSNGQASNFRGGAIPGFNGRVISVNAENNFVIVDIGETTGIRLGDSLSVYRDSKYIARLEVIQVRKDISAADLKDQWSKVKVGDIIR